MNVFTYCAAALLCVCGVSVLRSIKSDLAPYAAAGAGLILLLTAVKELKYFKSITDYINAYGGKTVFEPICKALIIALLCQLTAEICRDFGENGIASKVEFGGKIAIIYLSVPLIKEVLSTAETML